MTFRSTAMRGAEDTSAAVPVEQWYLYQPDGQVLTLRGDGSYRVADGRRRLCTVKGSFGTGAFAKGDGGRTIGRMSPRSPTAGRGRGRPPADDPSTLSTDVLLDAALTAFADRGFDGTSMRELARDLGVSHNLIPQRLGTKEQLWFAAVDHGFGALAVELMTVIDDIEEDADDLTRLRAFVVRFIEANAARPALLRIIHREASAPGPRLDHLFDRYIEPVRQFGADLLGRLHTTGQIRIDSVGLVYFLMTHGAGGPLALPGLAERFGDRMDPADPDAVHRHAVDATSVIFDGLLLNIDN